ncbi:MAG: hypothetical protein R2838_20385 [Caldilineaceae bacterium]
MVFDRALAQHQSVGNLAVGKTFGNQSRNRRSRGQLMIDFLWARSSLSGHAQRLGGCVRQRSFGAGDRPRRIGRLRTDGASVRSYS